MRSPFVHRTGAVTGLILLACWLGWTITSFAALASRPMADTSVVIAQLLAQLEGRGLLQPAGQPLAVHFPGVACACTDSATWPQTVQALRAHGGRAIEAPASVASAAGHELLVLARDGRPVYAGPLALPALYCGQGRAALDDWLPDLLSGAAPALILPPGCSC